MTGAAAATAPLLAALLGRALPGLAVLDLAAVAEGGLYPWLPRAMVGAGDPAALPPALAALLPGLARAGGTLPLAGYDPAFDAALAAGAPEAWGGAEHRLVVPGSGGASAFGAGPWLAAGMMVLARDAAPPTAERVMLVLGAAGRVERADLMLPDGGLPAVLPPLSAAARAMAAEAPCAGWEVGLRTVSARLAALTLFAPAPLPAGPVVLEREALVIGEDPARRRLRLMLGVLPAGLALSLRIDLEGGVKAPPALFLDGARHAARAEADARGGMRLAARIVPAGAGAPTVLGLAGFEEGAVPRVARLELGPA